MKKIVTIALGLSLLTSLYAMPNQSCGNNSCGSSKCGMQKMHSKHHTGMKRHAMQHNKNMKHNKGMRNNSPLRNIMRLDLTAEQKTKIQTIMQAHKNTAPKMTPAFSKNSFNKEQYIQNTKQTRDAKLQHKAELIDKIYATLTPAQKEALATDMNR